MSRLKQHYDKVVRPALIQEFSYKNPMEAPRIEKIVINMGVGEAVQDSKKVTAASQELAAIAGQRPIVTHATKAIAPIPLLEGLPIGPKVHLRADRLYEFLDRLVNT